MTATPTATPTDVPLTVTPTLTATPGCSLVPATLPAGTIGQAYSQQLTLMGGTNPVAFSVVSGAVPAGLTLSAAGLLAGTPTTAGTSSFTVRATDAGTCTVDAAYTLEILQTVPATPALFMGLLAMMLAVASWAALRRQTP
ncbi:MAG TPA: Ig domain-containing protein [Vicinamibacterales bacterium]